MDIDLMKNSLVKDFGALEKFLNDISIHPLLRSNEIFYDFFSINKEKDFNNKKK